MILPITHSLSSSGPQTAESTGKKTEFKMIRMISCGQDCCRMHAEKTIHLQLDVMQELHRTASANSDSVVTVSAAGCH